jgi:excisionase family DNA binding protein
MSESDIGIDEAAAILGISRALVVSRMDAGLLPFHQVGADRSLNREVVVAHKTDMDAKVEIMRRMYEELAEEAGFKLP